MKRFLDAVDAVLKGIELDENDGGLISRQTLRKASELRLERNRVEASIEEERRDWVSAADLRAHLATQKAEALEATIADMKRNPEFGGVNAPDNHGDPDAQ